MNLWEKFLALFKTKKTELPAPVKKPEVEKDPRELPDIQDKGSVVLAVIVGHEAKSQGAVLCTNGESEYKWNTKIANLMKGIASEQYPQIDVRIVFRDNVGIAGAYKMANEVHQADLAIELHFNGFNGQVRGTSTLCTTSPNDMEFAHIVQREMCRVFKRDGKGDRGVKAIARNARGGGNVHSFPGGANCLVEPFFGDNLDEVNMAQNSKAAYAECLLQATQLYAKKIDLIR
jgi:N-acetylmuramoyl-L-alanine amidase